MNQSKSNTETAGIEPAGAKQRGHWFFLLLLFTAYYTLIASPAVNSYLLHDPDVWWHLRTGQWIVEHKAFPFMDSFSQPLQGQRWYAYSWLFEVLLYGVFSHYGLLGVVGLTVILCLLIALALYIHVRRFVTNDLWAMGFALLGALGLAPLCNPRPWLFTILFFIIEYTLLIAARQTGKQRLRWWLVPLFALWANLHIQFIYGLFLLGFDTVQPWLEEALQRNFDRGRWAAQLDLQRWLLLLACGLATLATPYHYKIYWVVFEYAGGKRAFQLVTELGPLKFSSFGDWVVLGLALWAIFWLGWQQLTKRASLLLLLIGIMVALRSHRDIWFLMVIAIGIPAAALAGREQSVAPIFSTRTRNSLQAAAVLLTCLLLGGLAQRRQLSNPTLQRAVDEHFPAAAARVIEERGYHGPLYNHFNWGGYLIWRLPQLPVSMDGRTNLYGDARIVNHFDVWNGKRQWAQDSDLTTAGIVLTAPGQPLSELLRNDPRFELVYNDNVALLFRPRAHLLAQR